MKAKLEQEQTEETEACFLSFLRFLCELKEAVTVGWSDHLADAILNQL